MTASEHKVHSCQQSLAVLRFAALSRVSVLQQDEAQTEAFGTGSAQQHKDVAEAYLEQAAARQAEKDMVKQQMPSPPDAAINFSSAVGEHHSTSHCDTFWPI